MRTLHRLLQMITFLSSDEAKAAGWPVKLTSFPRAPGSDDNGDAASTSQPTTKPTTKPTAKPMPAQTAPASTKGGGRDAFLHEGLKKAEANELLTALGLDDGNFLIRGSAEKRVMSVVYKGKPTHHLVVTDPDAGGNFVINKKPFDANTLEAVRVRASDALPNP